MGFGFDINGFKNNFFSAMRNAGNMETQDSQINTEKEVIISSCA